MAQFWRIYNNQLSSAGEVEKLGFEESEGLRIPDEYLERREFVVMRTCHGAGDWGIISAMPRLLKEKYPDCKVYVPSEKLLEKLFGRFDGNWAWARPFANVHNVFDNNPYVDAFIDEYDGEIFHDHYRVYDKDNTKIPLILQMLKFWQFDVDELWMDGRPEIYWTDDEIAFGENIINTYSNGEGDISTLLLSDRFDYDDKESCDKILYQLELFQGNSHWLYWTSKPLREIPFLRDFKDALDLRHIDPRIQLYLKSKASVNIGNQCGMNDIIPRYATVITLPRGDTRENTIPGEIYI